MSIRSIVGLATFIKEIPANARQLTLERRLISSSFSTDVGVAPATLPACGPRPRCVTVIIRGRDSGSDKERERARAEAALRGDDEGGQAPSH